MYELIESSCDSINSKILSIKAYKYASLILIWKLSIQYLTASKIFREVKYLKSNF